MRWFIADTHFNHRNVITYDKRPFNDVKHMEDEIVRRWNNTVGLGDTVYHLGDFAFGPLDIQRELFSKLNGNKVLIRGNHDGTQSRCEKVGWKFVCDGLLINISGLDFFLIHDPSTISEDRLLIHGHTHRRTDRHNHLCVSCNLHNYVPVSEKQVLKQLNRREE